MTSRSIFWLSVMVAGGIFVTAMQTLVAGAGLMGTRGAAPTGVAQVLRAQAGW